MKAKKTLWIAGGFLTAIVAAVALWLLWYSPPLRASSDCIVTYTVSGIPHSDAQLFRPVGVPSRYYISLASPSAPQYRWFVVDFSRQLVALPSFGVTCPYGSPCIHRDQPLGLVLPDAKTEDVWEVSFAGNAVHFSNAKLSVNVTKTQ